MPTTVENLFDHFGLTLHGQTRWGQRIRFKKCGFYVVALSDKFDQSTCSNKPELNNEEIVKWINVINSGGKSIIIDKVVADLASIRNRLEQLWLPDETILYIGKAGPNKRRTVEKRLHEYFDTKFGSKKWHAGGHWLNSLKNLDSLNIYYTSYQDLDIDVIEEQMISYFMQNVSETTKKALHDPDNCYPFANKEVHFKTLNMKIRKNHGFENQTIDCGKDWKHI